jgi:hypothetical protein
MGCNRGGRQLLVIMKTYILTFAVLLVLACQEEEVVPVKDPFVGSWRLENTAMGLNVSFDITDALIFQNIIVEYPEITETLDCRGETYYRFAVNAGYEQIKILCSGDQVWLTLIMDHNRIHLKEPNLLKVYRLTIDMDGREPVELQDQEFVRAN